MACSNCFKQARGDVKLDYLFDHFGTDPNEEVGSFRLRGIAPAYQLQLKGPHAFTWQSAWTPAGDGIVRCRGCKATFDLKSGKEGIL